MSVLRVLLLIPALIYGFITEVRNQLFKKGILKSVQFDVATIAVGNLAVGGSGKTPMIHFLINQLYSKRTLAVLSRGYGRKTKGFYEVLEGLEAETTGDEPLEIKRKHPNIRVFVCEDRVMGVAELMRVAPETNLVLLDDAFQHQYIKPHISLLLSDAKKPFYQDFMMPFGRLREFAFNHKRANAVIFTKAGPGFYIPPKQRSKISRPIFISSLKTKGAKATIERLPDLQPRSEVVVVSALANNAAFVNAVHSQYSVQDTFVFRDHYPYKSIDIQRITKESENLPVVTTSKDWVKLEPLFKQNPHPAGVYVMQAEVQFVEEEKFVEWLQNKLAEVEPKADE
ncbi:MAG: tetraacyldisaccharide 4'-kinase [Bacteroidia bacterium]|jgi:tetraacyldisaccharide 4'-kinase